MNTLQQKALAWESFQAGAWEHHPDRTYFAAFNRRFPKEAALKKLEIEAILRQAFDAWWKVYREQKAASRRLPRRSP